MYALRRLVMSRSFLLCWELSLIVVVFSLGDIYYLVSFEFLPLLLLLGEVMSS